MLHLLTWAAMAASAPLTTATIAQAAPQGGAYVASLSALGDLTLLQGAQPLASLSFGAASPGWSWVGRVPDADAKDPIDTGFTWPGGKGRVSVKATAQNGAIRLVMEATPETTGSFETTHLNLQAQFGDWRGGTVLADATAIPLPARLDQMHLWTGQAKTFVLTQGNRRITVELDAPGNGLIQDGRQWGDSLDVRMGILPGAWPAGEKRVWTATVRADGPITLAPTGPITIRAGKDWVPYQAILDIQPGSALDWAPKTVSVPGSKGWLVVRNGRFEEEKAPGKPLRFYGTNLCFGAANPDAETAVRLAERLRRIGYNTVRLHHYDVELTGGFVSDQPGDSTQLDPAAMARFDLLFAEMKKRGLWVKIDLFTLRQLRRDEVLPGITGMDEFKMLLLVDDKARQNWLAFTRNLLNHVNPHTGLAYKDDPALAWICPVNENNAGSSSRSLSPAGRAIVDRAWQASGGTGSWTFETDAGARWATDRHIETYRWMRDQLRAIGTKALLTDNNGWHEQTALIRNRAQLDFVDNHSYWDHPNFLQGGWAPPSRSSGASASGALGGGLRTLALTRLKGKPFTVSEVNFCSPNPYRAEAGLLLGAFAARQDWDIVWRFAFSHSLDGVKQPVATDYFNTQSDPMGLATERAVLALFLRKDLAPAGPESVLRLEPSQAGAANYTSDATAYPFDLRLMSQLGGPPVPVLTAPPAPGPARVTEGVLTVTSERTAGGFAPRAGSFTAGTFRATLQGTGGAVWISSLDGKPLGQSQRLLLIHLTDSQNTETRFDGPDMRTLLAWGQLPHLVRDGQAQVSFATTVRGLKAWRLDASGKRLAPLPVTLNGGRLSLTTSVRGPEGATLYYEIATR